MIDRFVYFCILVPYFIKFNMNCKHFQIYSIFDFFKCVLRSEEGKTTPTPHQ